MIQDVSIRITVNSDGTVDIDILAPKETGCEKKCCEEMAGYDFKYGYRTDFDEDGMDEEKNMEDEEDDDEGFLYDNLD